MTKKVLAVSAFAFVTISSFAAMAAVQETNLCGAKVSYQFEPVTADTPPAIAAVQGLYGPKAWDSGTCNAVIVTKVGANGIAEVTYIYGTGPDVHQPGSFTKKDATVTINSKGVTVLKFTSQRGANIEYHLINGAMMGWFSGQGFNLKLQSPMTRTAPGTSTAERR